MKGTQFAQFSAEVLRRGAAAVLPQHLPDRWLDALFAEADVLAPGDWDPEAGDRVHECCAGLLGAVLWYLTRRAMGRAMGAGEGLEGSERIAAIARSFMRDVNRQPAFRRLLEYEPEAALRILTSKHGPIQQGVIEWTSRLLEQEEERGAIRLGIDRATLAYVMVRVGESFLYADVIAGRDADLDQAIAVVGQLLGPVDN